MKAIYLNLWHFISFPTHNNIVIWQEYGTQSTFLHDLVNTLQVKSERDQNITLFTWQLSALTGLASSWKIKWSAHIKEQDFNKMVADWLFSHTMR